MNATGHPVVNQIRRHFWSILIQINLFVSIVIVAGYWQTRNLPSGMAPQGQIQSLKAEVVAFPDRSPDKMTIVFFVAPWCGVCKLSMSNLDNIYQSWPDINVRIVALDYESVDDVKSFVSRNGVAAPVFLGDESVRHAWNITAYPTYFVLDQDLKIRSKAIGYSSEFGMLMRILWIKWLG